MDKSQIKISIAQMKIRHIYAFVYLCVLFTIVTFYMRDGYLNLGEDKYRAFRLIGLIGISGWIILRVIDLLVDKEKEDVVKAISGWRETKWFIVLYLCAAIISTVMSDFWMKSITGSDGWHIGLIFHVICVFSYIVSEDLVSKCGKDILYPLLYCFFLISAVAFVLVVLNRFSVYPFRIKGQEEDFISTLGNINWFCGYWSIWTGLAAGWFLSTKKDYSLIMSGLYVWICVMAGVCCGADSAYLAWAVISFMSLMLFIDDEMFLKRWIIMQLIALSTLVCIRTSGLFRPNRMWYDNSFLRGITYGNKWIFPIAFGVSICVIMYFCRKYINKYALTIRTFVCGCIGAIVLGFVVIMILNNIILGGIWPVRGKDFFWFNSAWGNGRGGIWMTTILIIRYMDPIKLLFGVGCDCYCFFAYSINEVVADISRQMGDLILTNAHNELLTMFVNEGIMGLIAYVGVMWTHLQMGIRHAKEDGIIAGVTFAIATYVLIGMIGFMQVLSTPFLFIAMGIMAGLTNSRNLNTIS